MLNSFCFPKTTKSNTVTIKLRNSENSACSELLKICQKFTKAKAECISPLNLNYSSRLISKLASVKHVMFIYKVGQLS